MEKINYTQIQSKLESELKTVAGQRNVYIGLSGGIDSSVACVLAKNALGADKVKGVILNNSKFSREVGLSTAEQFAKNQGISIEVVDVSSVREAILETLPNNGNDVIRIATLEVRLCDIYIKEFCSRNGNGLYLGTINSTERLCGWYPKGCLTGDYDLLGGLLKEQIKYLAREMGLEELIPTVSQEAKDICSGCGYLPDFEGIQYTTLDEVLYLLETEKKPDKISSYLEQKGISPKDYATIEKRVNSVKHKGEVFPSFLRINSFEEN